MNRVMGRLGLLLVAIIWGTGFAASSKALDYFNPYQILALRFTLAFLASLIVFYKELKNLKRFDLKKGSIIGVFLFFAFFFQTVGLQYTTASKNAFLTAVNIVIVPFLNWIILKRKVSKKIIIGAFVTLAGIMFLSVDLSSIGSLFSFNKGDLLTLVCAMFFALQIFYTDVYAEDVSVSAIMVAQMGTAMVLSWISVFMTRSTQMTINKTTMMPILYLGLVSTMVAYGIQTWAQKRTSSSEAAVILSTEALFGMLASVLILGEKLTVELIVGAVLIFIGIIIVETGNTERVAN